MKQYDVTVVGGGIIGLTTAYYLIKKGHSVQIIDSGKVASGAAEKNAALVVPSHFLPLAQPGVISDGIRWMFDKKSPFFIKPRLSLSLLKWLILFSKSSQRKIMQSSVPVLTKFLLQSRELFQDLKKNDLSEFHWKDSGLLCVYQTDKTREHELKTIEYANRVGIAATEVNLKSFIPEMNINAIGGVFYPEDATADPKEFMDNLLSYLKSHNTDIVENTTIDKINVSNNKITEIISGNHSFKSKNFVIAAGAYSNQILEKVGFKIPLECGKGYSLTCESNSEEPSLKCPMVFTEGRVVITPLKNKVRFAGTMEISGFDKEIKPNRIEGIKETVGRFLPDFNQERFEKAEDWYGFRPLSPDGLPFVGQHSEINNLYINTGHAMLGLTLATGSGKLISDLISKGNSNLVDLAFNPNRF